MVLELTAPVFKFVFLVIFYSLYFVLKFKCSESFYKQLYFVAVLSLNVIFYS